MEKTAGRLHLCLFWILHSYDYHQTIPSAVICPALPGSTSAGNSAIIMPLPLKWTTAALWDRGHQHQRYSTGAVRLETRTGKWSIWEIVSCIWVSDNCRVPVTHTHTYTSLALCWPTNRWKGRERPFRLRYNVLRLDCFGVAESFLRNRVTERLGRVAC